MQSKVSDLQSVSQSSYMYRQTSLDELSMVTKIPRVPNVFPSHWFLPHTTLPINIKHLPGVKNFFQESCEVKFIGLIYILRICRIN